MKPLVLAFFLVLLASPSFAVPIIEKTLEHFFFPGAIYVHGSVQLQGDIHQGIDGSVFWEAYAQGDGPVRPGLATYFLATLAIGGPVDGMSASTSALIGGLASCESSRGLGNAELPDCYTGFVTVPVVLGEAFLIRVSANAEVIRQGGAIASFNMRLSLYETTGEGVLIRSVPPPTHTPEPSTFLMAALGIVLTAMRRRILRSR